MALGDADLALFFTGGIPVMFSGVSTYPCGRAVFGNLDAPGRDAAFSGVGVQDTGFRLELPYNAFDPFPRSGDTLQVLDGPFTGSYRVHKATPVDDGLTVSLDLTKA